MLIQVQPMLDQEMHSEYRLEGKTNYSPRPSSPAQEEEEENADNMIITDIARTKIAEWAFEVADYFSCDRDVVAVALNYIDRFMVFNKTTEQQQVSSLLRCSKREFQLISIAALYLAMKLHGIILLPKSGDGSTERCARKPSLRLLVSLSRNMFTPEEIERMELHLLTQLQWKVHPPLPATFVTYFMCLFPSYNNNGTNKNGNDSQVASSSSSYQKVKSTLFDTARYLTELSTCASDFSFLFRPSVIGYAAILASIDALSLKQRHCGDPPSCLLLPPPPYCYDSIITIFLNNIHSETNLEPTMEDVDKARCMLTEFCAPSVFFPPDLPPNDEKNMPEKKRSNTTTVVQQQRHAADDATTTTDLLHQNPVKAEREARAPPIHEVLVLG